MESSVQGLIKYYPRGSYLLSVCKNSDGDFQGNVYFPAAAKAYAFSSAWNLLKQIDDDINLNRFPQCTFEPRRWSKKQGLQSNVKKQKKHEAINSGKPVCSFLIHVQYCQGATWQGSIQWLEEKQSRTFRSQFELLKLMEEALN